MVHDSRTLAPPRLVALMAILLTVLLMASLLSPSAAHAAPTVQEKELNDTTATAQRVDLGTTVQGKIEDRGWVTDF